MVQKSNRAPPEKLPTFYLAAFAALIFQQNILQFKINFMAKKINEVSEIENKNSADIPSTSSTPASVIKFSEPFDKKINEMKGLQLFEKYDSEVHEYFIKKCIEFGYDYVHVLSDGTILTNYKDYQAAKENYINGSGPDTIKVIEVGGLGERLIAYVWHRARISRKNYITYYLFYKELRYWLEKTDSGKKEKKEISAIIKAKDSSIKVDINLIIAYMMGLASDKNALSPSMLEKIVYIGDVDEDLFKKIGSPNSDGITFINAYKTAEKIKEQKKMKKKFTADNTKHQPTPEPEPKPSRVPPNVTLQYGGKKIPISIHENVTTEVKYLRQSNLRPEATITVTITRPDVWEVEVIDTIDI